MDPITNLPTLEELDNTGNVIEQHEVMPWTWVKTYEFQGHKFTVDFERDDYMGYTFWEVSRNDA